MGFEVIKVKLFDFLLIFLLELTEMEEVDHISDLLKLRTFTESRIVRFPSE